MKRDKIIFLLVLASVITLPIVFVKIASIPKYQYTYYYSQNKKQCVTRLDYESNWFATKQSYFTVGYYLTNKIPENYIRPYSVEYDRYWNAIISFINGKIYFMGEVGLCDIKNDDDKFTFVETSASFFSDSQTSLIERLRNDTSKNTCRVESQHTKWTDSQINP